MFWCQFVNSVFCEVIFSKEKSILVEHGLVEHVGFRCETHIHSLFDDVSQAGETHVKLLIFASIETDFPKITEIGTTDILVVDIYCH